MKEEKSKKTRLLTNLSIDGTLPHQINAPDYKKSTRNMEKMFVNEFGVVIGDSFYNSRHSPLNNWSTATDPSVMAGDRWVHPTNDIGWNTTENNEIVHDQPPKGVPFMHPQLDVSYGKD